jgi:4-hydroxy-tetrahydrodipicolinate synthase
MSAQVHSIEGVIPAPVSVFRKDRSFDYDAFSRQIEYLVEGGVNGVFLSGTTAEGVWLTAEERLRAAERVSQVAGDRVTIYAAVVRPGTREVIEELATFRNSPISYAAAVTPFYFPADQAELERHFLAIAEASPVPLMLYNIPQNTHNVLHVDTVLRLANHPNIVGVKDSSGDFKSFVHGLITNGAFGWVQGSDLLHAPSLLAGSPAVVTGLGNVEIAPYVAMYRAYRAGETETVWECQRRVNDIARIISTCHGKVIRAIKSATALQGRGTHYMRSAALDLPSALVEDLRATLAELGIRAV